MQTTQILHKKQQTAFIGHRLITDIRIKQRLIKAIENEMEKGCTSFIMGNHGDFDNMALATCRELRQIHNKSIQISVVLTNLNIFNKTHIDEKAYNPYSDVSTMFFDIENTHYKNRIIASNKKMIESSTTLICYVDPNRTSSCAKNIMNYAKKLKIKIINLFYAEDNPTFGMTKAEVDKYWDNFNKNLNIWLTTK